ncbi:hypothetical protein C2S51_033591 [Perilla frutescens var. frutescens]|nr:hypothetical protein C2S51_033591 [Perilla frutescens var. frutescens]
MRWFNSKNPQQTRPLSLVLKSAEIVAAAPDGPNSGYLVIQDEESETYSLLGLRKDRTVKKLPLPQNKELAVRYPRSWGLSANVSLPIDVIGDVALDAATSTAADSSHSLFFIPLLNHPLSSNRYYAVLPHGKHNGEAVASSNEEDEAPCCFSSGIEDAKPRPLDPNDVYQQLVIIPGSDRGSFTAKSAAEDGFPPKFLRKKGWTISSKTPPNLKLGAAQGLDSQLDSPAASSVVGKWYTPFIFVKEGTLRDQVERSMYYEVTLEQRWDRIYSCRREDDDDHNQDHGNSVVIDATFEKEQVFVGGSRASWNEKSAVDGVIWFKVDGGGGVGLRVELVERRMDGSLVMSYDFKHFHQLKTKWE